MVVIIFIPFGFGSDEHHDSQSDSFMQVTVLDGQSDDDATQEYHVGLFHVIGAHSAGAEDAQYREEDHW